MKTDGRPEFSCFPELSARTEYGCDIAGNPGRQNRLKKGVRSLSAAMASVLI